MFIAFNYRSLYDTIRDAVLTLFKHFLNQLTFDRDFFAGMWFMIVARWVVGMKVRVISQGSGLGLAGMVM